MAKDDFDLVNLPEEVNDPEIKKEDFVLQQADSTIHEQRFQTKPTTFWKDSLKRFSKNKSSVVAAYILGFLVLLAIFVPIFDRNDVSTAANSALKNLEPKLFDGGGFWDGTIKVNSIPVDKTNLNEQGQPMPDPALYLPGGIKDLQLEGEKYTNEATPFGIGGYVQFGYYGGFNAEQANLNTRNPSSKAYPKEYTFTMDLSTMDLKINKFTVVDEEQLKSAEGNDKTIPENFTLGLAGVDFVYIDSDPEDSQKEKEFVVNLVEPALTHDIGANGGEVAVDVKQKIMDATSSRTTFDSFYFRITVKGQDGTSPESHVCSLIKNLTFETTSTDEKVKAYFSSEKVKTEYGTEINGISFNDAMEMIVRTDTVGLGAKNIVNIGFWQIDSAIVNPKRIYLGKAEYASFTYDSYLATLGPREIYISSSDLTFYSNRGWVNFDFEFDGDGNIVFFDFEIINKSMCPILEELDPANVQYEGNVGGHDLFSVKGTVMYYKYLDPYATSMPKYLFGTDSAGKDMLKYVFEGLRNSLLLGVFTFIVCFLFGLLWGSISGYFGGAVDLVMERLTDILSGVPWIVVMTLVILKTGKSDFGTFALALCLTGWIGTASTTRTQFYRFRGREYVLASRTLGASDARLITKHILPNAMGTIITGAVLMIPSVIFSEATISYLGLGFKSLSSLGVILSSNQSQLTNHPYQLLFPSAVIALVMISFNLFGNGLRDAINPSLKGEEE